jgi:hypothetical protein
MKVICAFSSSVERAVILLIFTFTDDIRALMLASIPGLSMVSTNSFTGDVASPSGFHSTSTSLASSKASLSRLGQSFL